MRIVAQDLGTTRLLEALVEDLPSPAMRGPVKALDAEGEEIEIPPDEDGELVAYVFKTLADPYAGRLNLFRVYSGVLKGARVTNVTRRAELAGTAVGAEGKARKRGRDGRRRHRRRREAEGPAPAMYWRPRTPRSRSRRLTCRPR